MFYYLIIIISYEIMGGREEMKLDEYSCLVLLRTINDEEMLERTLVIYMIETMNEIDQLVLILSP